MRLTRPALFALTALVLALVPACGATPGLRSIHGGDTGQDQQNVARLLAGITVVDRRIHVIGYAREHFGGWSEHWYNHGAKEGNPGTGGTVCTTRQIMMLETFPGTMPSAGDDTTGSGAPCPSAAGSALDVYTGKELSPDDVEIDHVVALSAAWDHGAYAWSHAERVAFANDREHNLLAVAGPVNQAKSDATLGEWTPPLKSSSCAYAARYLTVTARYSLSISWADAEAAGSACGL
jgi:hypothetical protein